MPDFFSRLVKRTFGLMTVTQPATSSIFDPGISEKSDYLQSLASNNEPASNQDDINIDSSRKTRTIPQYDNWPALNREKSFNEYDMKSPGPIKDKDIQRDFTSISEPLHNIESLEQNDPDFPVSIESIFLQARSGKDNRDFHTPSAKLIQDDSLFYKIGSYTLESIEPETLHSENRNDRNTLLSIPKMMLLEEQFDKNELNSQEYIESQKDFKDIKENTNTLVPIIRQSYDKEQARSTETISLKQTGPEPSLVGLQEKQDLSLSAASEPESTYEGFSAPEPSSKNSGENSLGQKSFVDIVDGIDSHVELGKKGFRDARENTNILMPMTGQSYYKEHSQTPEVISLKQKEPKPSYSVGLEKNQNIIRNTTAETDLPYENFYIGNPSSKSSGENSSGQKEPWQKEPFVNGLDSLAGESIRHNVSGSSHKSSDSSNLIGDETALQNREPVSRKDFDQPGHLHSGAGSSPMAPGRQNLKRMSESTYEASVDNRSNSKNSGKSSSGQKEPFVDSLHSRAGKSLLDNLSDSSLKSVSQSSLLGNEINLQNREPVSKKDFNPPEHLNSDSGSSSVTPGGQNLKRITNPKVNTIPGQMENMLIEQHAVARRLPPVMPTIKVTIGRIEVRAVEPPRASQPQAPPPPKQYPILSLDDYLKQSNG